MESRKQVDNLISTLEAKLGELHQDPLLPYYSQKWSVSKVRQTFVDYFVKKSGHTFVPSSPVVPHDDPTLLFTNAGMNQFKPIFLGQVDPKNPMAKLSRACNSQKCIRAGGKHNDLEDVGKDTYHHTFFEMLGNWSFGDYFKKEAIAWAWELLTEVYGLPKDRLYATYFGGDKETGLPADDEAKAIWLQYLPTDRVLPFGMKENFWEMGDTGPCGPCSEIHFDRVGGRYVPHLVNADSPELIEIWNLVFMQFNREADKSLKSLPAKHVDTGMGLERITSILQKRMSNYDTDVFTPIFDEIQRVTGAPKYSGKVGKEDVDQTDMAYRVIADHIRTLSFAIADGAVPSAEGRGYVLRRVLRRGVRYGRQILKAKPGFFSQLVGVVVQHMKDFFPELEQNQDSIIAVIEDEERSFERTMDKGIDHFTKALSKMSPNDKVFSGADAFLLYDTYGFPLDLTQLMAAERGLSVDWKEFNRLMEKAKETSRLGSANALGGEILQLGVDETSRLQGQKVPPTDDTPKHDLKPIKAKLLTIWNGKEFVQEVKSGDQLVGLVLDRTNFYAESGGQTYDMGTIKKSNNATFDVVNVQSFAGYVLHMGKLTKGSVKVNDTLDLEIDVDRRIPTMINHTSTHILNFALRKVLKGNQDQKGSLVDPEKLRFDFSHNKPMSPEEIDQVERICSKVIGDQLPVYSQSVPLSLAKSINAVRAVFGETYPDPVTVVSVGKPIEELLKDPNNNAWFDYSIEFCGGTHLKNSAEARAFVIISESGIAKGVRRIVAMTGPMALKAQQTAAEFQDRLDKAKTLQKEELVAEIALLQVDVDAKSFPYLSKLKFQKQIEELVRQSLAMAKDTVQDVLSRANEVAAEANEKHKKLIVEEIAAGSDRKAGSSALLIFKEKCPGAAVMLFSKDSKTVTMFVAVGKSLTGQISAAQWTKEVTTKFGGKGGGKDTDAQGTLSDVSKFTEAMEFARSFASKKLGL